MIFTLDKTAIYQAIGLGDGDPDETAVSTINVRLDEMFREAKRDAPYVIQVSDVDLTNLAGFDAYWQDGAKCLSSKHEFTAAEGLNDQAMWLLNHVPSGFVHQLKVAGFLTFCHSPMFKYSRSRKKYTIEIWMRIVYAPESKGN